MAKRQPDRLGQLFKPTEPGPAEAEEASAPAPGQQLAERSTPAADETDRTLPIGVGMKQSDVREFDRLARELGIARNALMRFALLWFLREYKAGRVTVDVEETITRRIKNPR